MMITEDQLRAKITQLAANETQRGLARRLGFKGSQSINDIIRRNAPIYKGVAEALGYRMVDKKTVRYYEKVKSKTGE